jgi:signal transduction histidine kinase/CheY-like chemotaxis protein/purine-cytosine permease-like protein
VNPATAPQTGVNAPQRVIKTRRDYNSWVARETIEDYALRFTPRSFRKWSEWRVANTAFGAASFLILEAVGATLLVQYGFVNAALAILATGLVIFLAGWPISVYAARYGLDMDLLTRGAGFGYIGSTITSLIYASFTFIFFALEAAVMAYALELAFDIPPAWGYLICALVVIPLVTHGVTAIGRLQVWTQPLWLVMLVVPYIVVFHHQPDILSGLVQYGGAGGGADGEHAGFDLLAFGAATTVGIALITQMGEQADYLRFMPERTRERRGRWWFGVLVGGPGWVVLGVAKMLGGALLAYLVITLMVPVDRAVDPNQMYLAAYNYLFPHYGWAVAATALFVVISQLKINVTNAYAGSLAWSNFFARLTHAHPGRVVWMVFNTAIALVLMQMNVFSAIGHVLGLYANIAIAWMMAVVADLVINKPLGWSPKGIEFRRAHLYDINPVGVGAMGIASVLSVVAHLGAFGPLAQAFSATIALVTAFVVSPLIAWATKGRWYIARRSIPIVPVNVPSPAVGREPVSGDGAYLGSRLQRCGVCEREYEGEDMASCPAYQTSICSLCCTLDARCNDLCKPDARLGVQWLTMLKAMLPRRMWPQLEAGLAHYLLLMALVLPALALLLAIGYTQSVRVLGEQVASVAPLLRQGFVGAFLLGMIGAGIVAWWLVLAQRSREAAHDETNRQTEALQREIESHARTDAQLQQARLDAEQARGHAEAANRAKSRYITTISHELRTPLNSILGYAQLLEEDEAMPAHRRQAVSVIRRGGDHLLSLIEGTLDIARIESGKLAFEQRPMRFADGVAEIARLFELQAAGRGIGFVYVVEGTLPAVVRTDEKRLRQILINLLGNAVKFTARGQVTLRVMHQREMARFDIEDTGPGMTADELSRVFEPFERGSAAGGMSSGSTGLGLTIARMLTDLMGGEMTVASTPGQGTTFTIRLFLPELHMALAPSVQAVRTGYEGRRRRILVVDNEEADRRLLADLLQPLGFQVGTAASGEEALAVLAIAGAPQPDAVFMDLAMPGIDGWQTIRRLRAAGHTMPLAVVSANAFDKRLDNDVGLPSDDFLVKPVRLAELLDWLGRRLSLVWTTHERADHAPIDPAAGPAAEPMLPPPAQLEALHEAVSLGHVRGIGRVLDTMASADPAHAAFVTRMRTLAGQFRYEVMDDLIRKALNEPRTA